jgi:hydrogenase maturation factor
MSAVKGIIDRFEEEYAVIEIGDVTKDVLRELLPREAKPGDVVIIKDNEITIGHEETEKRRKEMKNLMDDLWEM